MRWWTSSTSVHRLSCRFAAFLFSLPTGRDEPGLVARFLILFQLAFAQARTHAHLICIPGGVLLWHEGTRLGKHSNNLEAASDSGCNTLLISLAPDLFTYCVCILHW